MQTDSQRVVIVGQAPNERCWRRELAYGESLMARMEAGRGATPPLEFAERACAKLAITGTVGKRVARLLGVEFPRPFINQFERRNLNARWTGKRHGADAFDEDEGLRAALRLLEERPLGKFVLLGRAVGRCFAMDADYPWLMETGSERTARFLLVPHPSGLARWWNSKENVQRASEALRAFCGIELSTETNHV